MVSSFTENFKKNIYCINEENFESTALVLFEFQYNQCIPYQTYCNFLNKNPTNVKRPDQIPFLPIEFFKSFAIKSGKWQHEKCFLSSGTTGSERGKHYIRDFNYYLSNSKAIFEEMIGSVKSHRFIALLPSYLKQGHSSLIAMVAHFIEAGESGSGFYKLEEIASTFPKGNDVLFGVTYALLDLAESRKSDRPFIIIETGGMKGQRKELIREEFHTILLQKFPNATILTEYGMTELLSQGYGGLAGVRMPAWCKVLIRDVNDPFQYLKQGKIGGINIIDMANVHTCSFIETKDIGRITKNGLIEVLGRFDNSDLRGCNLMI